MIDFAQIGQCAAETFTDGLMTEAHTEDGFLSSVCFDDIEQKPCLAGNARAWGEDDFVEGLELLHLELVVAKDRHVGSQFFDEMTQIVGERVVVVYNCYFHNFSAISIAFLKAPSLLFTSCSSYSTSLFATMPPPAWNHSSLLRETKVRMVIA